MRNLLRGGFLALTFTIVACDGSSPTASVAPIPAARLSGGSGGGGGTGGSGPTTFLTTVSGAPALAQSTLSFYAVQGQDRTAEIFYSSSGNGGAHRFLRFLVRKGTQIVRPDGTLLANGDSIQITITVVDPTHLVAQFEPSGLHFNGGGSAKLTISYVEVDQDLNHDGVINSLDSAIASTFSIFRQEDATAPWIRVASSVSQGLTEVEATIGGFTNYVIAY